MIFNKLFGKREKQEQLTPQEEPQPEHKLDIEIKFHKDTNEIGEHGSFYADHVQRGLVNEPIRFAFVGLIELPSMTPELLNYIWDQAERYGYIPHSLRSYASVFPVLPAPAIRSGMSIRNEQHHHVKKPSAGVSPIRHQRRPRQSIA
jgi:hypothetical protein